MLRGAPKAIRAVLFDFDGTLTKPGRLDFPKIKRAIQCPADTPILEFIETLSSPERKAETLRILDRYEIEAAAASVPNPGAETLIPFLKFHGIAVGIISRNSLRSILRALDNFRRIGADDFDLIVSRDDPIAPKPSEEGVLLAAHRLRVGVDRMLVVGDYIFDVESGNRAGAMTAFLENRFNTLPDEVKCEYRLAHLDEIKGIIRMQLPLAAGKLPGDLLERLLRRFSFKDPSVLVNPGTGEDVAAVDVTRNEVMVLKSDPITFTTDMAGHYSVLVNANDIATAGAVPRWFLTTLLFPSGTTPQAVEAVMRDLHNTCRRHGITLCGGHTEITDAVSRPVVIGMMTGTVSKKGLIEKQNIRRGDKVLFTKRVAVEGTAIIARDFEKRLRGLGLTTIEIEQGQRFVDDISILEEASIAARFPGISAMHDVTEGGLATALMELSSAGGHRICVDMDHIPVFPVTAKICRLLGLDPLGLIGSGSLLICCRARNSESLMKEIQNVGIDATIIGWVSDRGRGVETIQEGSQRPWPFFEVDEITKLFQ